MTSMLMTMSEIVIFPIILNEESAYARSRRFLISTRQPYGIHIAME